MFKNHVPHALVQFSVGIIGLTVAGISVRETPCYAK